MKLKHLVSVGAWVCGILLAISSLTPSVAAAQSQCFCAPSATANAQFNVSGQTGPSNGPRCLDLAQDQACTPAAMQLNDKIYTCSIKASPADCAAATKDWNTQVTTQVTTQNTQNKTIGLGIPACLAEPTLSPDCRDISIFIKLLINLTNWIFGIIGAVALAVFVYGGFMLIISGGNSEKVTQGIEIITAAVIGLFVAFAGYMLIQFIGTSLNIKDVYRLS